MTILFVELYTRKCPSNAKIWFVIRSFYVSVDWYRMHMSIFGCC